MIAWSATPVRWPPSPPDVFVHAVDVNRHGAVLATATTGVGTTPRQRAFVWRNGKVVVLGYGRASFVDATALNDRGHVIGDARGEGVLWRDGRPTALGAFTPMAVNEADVVVGDGNVRGTINGFVWKDGVLTDIGTIGGTESHAWAVNAIGEVAGAATTPSGAGHAIVWQDGVLTDLGTVPGRESTATALNDAGLVVGRVADHLGLTPEAVEWRSGKLVRLGRFGAKGSVAVAVNRAGDVLVQATTAAGDPLRAYVLRDGKTIALPVRGRTVATVLDDEGQVLGTFQTAALGRRTFVWRNGRTTLLPTTDGPQPPWGGPAALAGAYAAGDEYVPLENGRATSRPVLWRRR